MDPRHETHKSSPASSSPKNQPENLPISEKPRIQTQIHRRKKAKAVPPLHDEWDSQSPDPPQLKTSNAHMKKK